MTLNRTNIVLAVILALVVLSTASVRVNFSQPNFEIALGKDMTYSPAYDSYEPNPNFPNGTTLQVAVPGTIARDEMPLHYEATPESAQLAGEQLVNPRDPSSEDHSASVQRGGTAFQIFCTACHGGGGGGDDDGPVAKRGFPPPPSLLAGKSVKMKDGQLFHILTYGQASMPTFAAQLSPDQRWDVVNYVRSLQRQAAPQDEPAADDTETPAAADDDAGDDGTTAEPVDEGVQDEPSHEELPALPGDDDGSSEPNQDAEPEPADEGEPAERKEADVPPATEPSDADSTGSEPTLLPPAGQTETTKDTERQP